MSMIMSLRVFIQIISVYRRRRHRPGREAKSEEKRSFSFPDPTRPTSRHVTLKIT